MYGLYVATWTISQVTHSTSQGVHGDRMMYHLIQTSCCNYKRSAMTDKVSLSSHKMQSIAEGIYFLNSFGVKSVTHVRHKCKT